MLHEFRMLLLKAHKIVIFCFCLVLTDSECRKGDQVATADINIDQADFAPVFQVKQEILTLGLKLMLSFLRTHYGAPSDQLKSLLNYV